MKKLLLFALILVGSLSFAQDTIVTFKGKKFDVPLTGYGQDTLQGVAVQNRNSGGNAGFMVIVGADTLTMQLDSNGVFYIKGAKVHFLDSLFADGGINIDTITGAIAASQIVDLQDSVTANTNVTANTTHRTSDGSDHTFIDQDVTSTGSPTFDNLTADSISVDSINIDSRLTLNGISADSIIPASSFTGNLANSTTDADTIWSSVFDGNRLYLTDVGGADSALIFDDGDTTRFESDNPIKIGNGSLIIATDGTISVSREVTFINNAAAVTFGAIGTDADVVVTFDAVTNQGSITYMEDEDRFDFDNDVNIAGDLTVTGSINGGVYGTQGFADSMVTLTMTQNVYVTITNPSSNLYIDGVESGDLIFTGDSIQIVTAGDYIIMWDLSYKGANTDEYHIAIHVNNVELPGKGEATRDMTGTSIGLSCAHTILTIAATHWLSLRIKNVNNNNDATIVAGNLNITKK